jgi:hypothetical protein
MSFGKGCTTRFGPAVVQLNGVGQGGWAAEQVAELSDRSPFTGAGIENRELLICRGT